MSKTNILKAIAIALRRGGIKTAYNFPGFHSHKLFNYLDGKVTSTNEKIAYELAWGSSQAGKPALVTFKNVGLNDAADPFINSMLTGVGSGLVLAVFDDIELEGSQCILDSRHYFSFYGGLWLEPFDFTSATALAEAAPQLSRIFDVPVVLRFTNHTLRFREKVIQPFPATKHIVDLAEIFAGRQFAQPQVEPIVHPVNGDAHHKLITTKNGIMQPFVNELHRLINKNGMHGGVYNGYTESSAGGHIVTLPVPVEKIDTVKTVHEVGDAVIAKELAQQATAAKFTPQAVGYSPKHANHYIITHRYERLFRLLKPHFDYITGDLGKYTKDTQNTLTHCLCFGSAISAATGMIEAGKNALAITGDASFYHSAKNVIPEAQLRNVPVKIVLLDNGGSQGSGGQKIPGTMPSDIDVTEIELDTIGDKALKKEVDYFIGSQKAALLKVNHEVE